MPDMTKSLYNIRLLDELAERGTAIHHIHPLIKVLTTGVYVIVTVSFGKYELAALLPLIFYPVILLTLADIPLVPVLQRALLVSPLIIGIGIFNPLLDKAPMIILPWLQISGGWISFLSLLTKGFFTILAALILIATTGMTRIASALQMLRIPKLFIMQLLLTYRYISVLIEEVIRVMRAHSLRSFGGKGVKYKEWGPLIGQLLFRTLERAQHIYHSMCCRGFTGAYYVGKEQRIAAVDILYVVGWSFYFVLVRSYDVPALLGSLIMGVGR
ncbi:cobalt ECF transporter T component CbiQ [Metallumcola ferriviriculae]|uniref:Cobalt ECF transporter T component CbiQ n=1 Tax=Metallumcola ferriviriculae TaxID=3039180 RepID=A0AAU0USI2_9FIRM|nr:cobalt ECF transporter T component CbiQ [Desulfitibacteraceae bacterium MK1]